MATLQRVLNLVLATLGVTAGAAFLCFVFNSVAHAQWISPSFWKQHDETITISTVAQSVYEGDCSGAFTIQNNNWLGVAAKPPANVTVSLSGTNVTFYSNNSCSLAITTTTIATYATSMTVYFVATTTGSLTITASTTSPYHYPNSTSQTETITTNPFVWTGGGADANWTTAANWSGGAAPGSSDTAVFDGTCSTNCSPTINANISLAGIRLESGYAGTITQGSASSVTVQDFIQFAGAYVGSAGGMTASVNFSLDGGSFTSGAQTITANSGWGIHSGTQNLTGSTFYFTGTAGMWAGAITYDNVEFGGSSVSNSTSPMNISGNLTILTTQTDSGTYNVAGNLTLTGGLGTGSATIVLNGTSAQTVSSTLAWPSGGIKDSNTTAVVTQSSAMSAGTSSGLTLSSSSASWNMAGYALTVNTLTLNGGTITKNGGTLTVGGTVVGTGSLYGGTVNP